MALSQRAASRFYAAFYRWSCYTRQPQQCALAFPSCRPHTRTSVTTTVRTYHATRLLRQQEQPRLQDEEPTSNPRSEGTHKAAQTDTDKASRIRTSYDEMSQNEARPSEVEEPEVDTAKLKNDVRSLMRNVPSSVAIVTVASYDAEFKEQVPMGVAVSSLSTVTLDPPTISFNIKQPSKTLDAIRAAKGLFRVHFPSADRGGAAMVELFCRGNHRAAYVARMKGLKIFVPRPTSLTDRLRSSASLAPQLLGDSVRASIECTLTQELAVEDHVILIAKVDSLVGKTLNDRRDRAIIYVDGAYLKPDGTRINSHGTHVVLSEDAWSVWDYPIFPHEEHRRDYVARIKAIVRQNPKALQPGKDTLRDLEATLALSPGALGINLERLVDDCRREAGNPSTLRGSSVPPLFSEFWGRLTPSDRVKIIGRAKDIVKEDPRFLMLNYRRFLQLLGVSPASIDLLPSDFMEPLRAEGLAEPFQARTGDISTDTRYHSVRYLEQVEHRLRQHFAAEGYSNTITSRLDDIMQSFGEARLVASYFKKSRARLHSEASPELFSGSNIDISGEASPEEVRVVMSRVIKFMQVNNPSAFRKSLNVNPHEVLRLLGVHPCITGFNVEFFFGKLKHMLYSTQYSRDLPGLVDKMLEPWFVNTVTWEDLGNRITDFVQKKPMRAMSWSLRDNLAAIGLSWETTLRVPVSTHQQPLNRGHIFETIVAKELKNLYGKSSKELDEAISRHLKTTYNYDVQMTPIQYSPAEEDTRSSSDVLEEARKANRNVDVYGNSLKRAIDWEERAASAEPNVQSASKSRIRGRGEQGLGSNGNGQKTPYRQRTPLTNTSSWKSFQIGDGQ